MRYPGMFLEGNIKVVALDRRFLLERSIWTRFCNQIYTNIVNIMIVLTCSVFIYEFQRIDFLVSNLIFFHLIILTEGDLFFFNFSDYFQIFA